MKNIGESEHGLFAKTAHSFVSNFRRAMRVAAQDEDGEPAQITQKALADRWGVSRSTIAEYVSGDIDGRKSANPDLKSICQLAEALNVSPAFLLMRPEDWSHLAQAVMFLSTATQDEKFREMADELMLLRAASPASLAKAGLKVAEKLHVYENKPLGVSGQFQEEIDRNTRRIQAGILATSVLPPFGELKPGMIPPLLSLCAILGAHL